MDALFDADEFDWWREMWVDMPAFSSRDVAPHSSITVNFANAEDRRRFLERDGWARDRVAAVSWPPVERVEHDRVPRRLGVDGLTRYPVFVISKGRSDVQLTSGALSGLGIPHFVVVEPPEEELYAEGLTEFARLRTLPFADLGEGSIPARNWCWEESVRMGCDRHWVVDDNIRRWYRLNENVIAPVVDFNPFAAIEDLVDRYSNIPMAGPNYLQYADKRHRQPPLKLNTRVYSCILLSNREEDRIGWRGRYNEDTDLSLRFLKRGDVTALFNHVLIDKTTTMVMAGGNTDDLYRQDEEFDGREAMTDSLVEQHPDCVSKVWKWGRWQHQVDYRRFRGNRPAAVAG